MIDVASAFVGVVVGAPLGFLASAVLNIKRMEEVAVERDTLQQKLDRLTDRDARGRFTRKEP